VFERILVGYDGRTGAEDELALGRTLADATGCPLSIGRVFPDAPWLLGDRLAELVERRRRAKEAGLLDELASVAEEWRGEAEPVPSSSPARGLTELAEEVGADLIVVGSSHRGDVGRVLLGSTSLKLLQGGPCAVAVASRGFSAGDRRLPVLGLAYDGSPEARTALRWAIELGRRLESTMRVVTVDAPVRGPAAAAGETERHDWYERQLAEAMSAIPRSIRPAGNVEHGDPVAVIVEEAERGIDLLVLGSRGYGPVRRALIGGVSAAVLERAPCPVLIVPRPPE
jgi:nucleotide-binding universal stress UspA family protein